MKIREIVGNFQLSLENGTVRRGMVCCSIGGNVKLLIDRPDGTYCFREQKERVYYVSEEILHLAETVGPDHLVSFGTCFGKFTKGGRFHLHITALSYLAPYAQQYLTIRNNGQTSVLTVIHRIIKSLAAAICSPVVGDPYKIWVKPSAEQQFLYGHNVLKSGLGRITENTPRYQGVVVLSMSDLPLGFGAVARSTAECKHADPMSIVCFHQADIGEYIRSENALL
ncbi:hypothetical protein PR048_010841 [Dryococelus australis]|uniref:60S ribosome subunit biogenesis protein NIP7 homolog n=1 Tax=Dryococelus australis TaxID=614101 RepID=A0ABQ9I4W5_9NEOP|nr:hypothetical protein PR048_010841 [Dryococelus australis]